MSFLLFMIFKFLCYGKLNTVYSKRNLLYYMTEIDAGIFHWLDVPISIGVSASFIHVAGLSVAVIAPNHCEGGDHGYTELYKPDTLGTSSSCPAWRGVCFRDISSTEKQSARAGTS